MKLKIGICDDEKFIGAEMKKEVSRALENRGIEFSIHVYNSGENLCYDMEEQQFDLVFLDIELPKMNGVEIGRFIRDKKNDNYIQIVYVSSHQRYAMELFEVRPINFLLKPINRKQIENVIDTFIKLNGGIDSVFTYLKNRKQCRVELSRIISFEQYRRKIVITTLDGKDEFYDSIKKIYPRLKNKSFLYIHESYIVNYRYIKSVESDKITLIDGSIFSISRSMKNEVHKRIIELGE